MLVGSAGDAMLPPPAIAGAFGAVRTVAFDTRRFGRAGERGRDPAATAPVVALSDDHCFPEPGWGEALVDAHRGPWAAVGPVVANANPGSLVSWVYFCHRLRPVGRADGNREAPFLPRATTAATSATCCSATGTVSRRCSQAETVLHLRPPGPRAPAAGLRGRANPPRQLLADQHLGGASQLRNGRVFAAVRREDWSPARCAAYAVASPLIPLVRLARSAGPAARAWRGVTGGPSAPCRWSRSASSSTGWARHSDTPAARGRRSRRSATCYEYPPHRPRALRGPRRLRAAAPAGPARVSAAAPLVSVIVADPRPPRAPGPLPRRARGAGLPARAIRGDRRRRRRRAGRGRRHGRRGGPGSVRGSSCSPTAAPPRARNRGAAAARGRLLAFTDDDCRPEAGWLAALEAALTARPDAMVGGPGHEPAGGQPLRARQPARGGHRLRPLQRPARTRALRRLEQPGGAGGGVRGRRRLRRVASVVVASEDRDLCDRWTHAGRPLVYAAGRRGGARPRDGPPRVPAPALHLWPRRRALPSPARRARLGPVARRDGLPRRPAQLAGALVAPAGRAATPSP